MKRPTMIDVAAKAGVGVATVDRVLSGRRPVREETARRVFEAAEAIGYHSTPVIRFRLEQDRPRMRFGFVLPKQHQPFYLRLVETLRREVEQCDVVQGRSIFRFAETQSPSEHARLLEETAGHCDAVAASLVAHQSVSSAVERVSRNGVPVFSILNEFAPQNRHAYLGLDNYRAGRAAGWLLSNAIREPGTIAVIVGGNLWQGHQQRETGLRSHIRERSEGLSIQDSVLNTETGKVTYELVLDLLATVDNLKGLYITGGGVEGAIEALKESSRPGQIKMVAHILNDETRAALEQGWLTAVIATPVDALAASLVKQMSENRLNGQKAASGFTILHPEIHLPEYV